MIKVMCVNEDDIQKFFFIFKVFFLNRHVQHCRDTAFELIILNNE